MVQSEVEERKPVFGVNPDAADQINAGLDSLEVDIDELSEGGLADILCTIIGWDFQKGGEEKDASDGGKFTTSDTILMHLRIDNAEDLGLDNPYSVQYLRLPKETPKGRAKHTRNSSYGIWLQAFDGLGISSSEEMAFRMRLGNIQDLTGLMYHRERKRFKMEGRTDDQSFTVDVPTELFGFDNDIRKGAKMKSAELLAMPGSGDEQAAS